MEKKEIYLVQFRKGSFEDTFFFNVFATFEEETAVKYTAKFNKIVAMAKKHYLNSNGSLKKKYKNTFIEEAYFNYYDDYSDPECFYERIKIK